LISGRSGTNWGVRYAIEGSVQQATLDSNRILGKASDGSGQTRCRRKCGSSSEENSSWTTFSDSKPFDLPRENISDASLSLDDLWCARVVLKFAAKAENLHVYAAIEHVFVDSSRL
jgi:hypothetical protein